MFRGSRLHAALRQPQFPPRSALSHRSRRQLGASGKLLTSWGDHRFYHPHGLRVDSHDNIWVTDLLLQQVFKFSNDGKLLLTLGTERTAGEDATHFNQPTDVAFASDGSIYVSDGYANNRIAKFSGDGKFLLAWGHKGGKPGEFDAARERARVTLADRELKTDTLPSHPTASA